MGIKLMLIENICEIDVSGVNFPIIQFYDIDGDIDGI